MPQRPPPPTPLEPPAGPGPDAEPSGGGWSGGWAAVGGACPEPSLKAPQEGDPAGAVPLGPPARSGATVDTRVDAGPRYAVGALLGRGGMGVVRAARDLQLGRDVAVKEVAAEAAADPAAQGRLAREAAITARLDHPGIVAVHDVGHLPDGRLFYTMRLVRGRSLSRAVAEAGAPEQRRALLRSLLAAAEAVAAAHEAGVVHRDLKPDNILIGPHGETQVVDWGLAAPTPAAARRWAELPGAPPVGPVGTPRWMAPEQAAGAEPDPRHDVYALGLILGWLIGEAERAGAPELAAICARATSGELGARYPTGGGFAADLLAWFEGRRVGAHPYTRRELLARTARAWRAPLWVAGVGAVGIAAAVAAGWASAERSLRRALDAEAQAEDALAALQLDQAVAATRAGARQRAETLALTVLRYREDPLARGVFAAFGRVDRPRLLRVQPGPACAWTRLAPGAAFLLCGEDGAVSRWEGGARAWSAPVSGQSAAVVGDEIIVFDGAGGGVALDPATGAARPAGAATWARALGDWTTMGGGRRIWAEGAPLDLQALAPSGCAGRIHAAARRDDGRVAAVCDDGALLLGDPTQGPPLRRSTPAIGDHVATAVAWTPSGAVLVGTLRGRLYSFSGEDGAQLSVGSTDLGAIVDIAVSPDGRLVALDGAEGGVGLWSLQAGALLAELPAARPRSVAFAADGLTIFDGSLWVWRSPSGAPSVLRADVGLADVTVSSDGERVITAGGEGWVGRADLRTGVVERLSLGDRVVKAGVERGAGLLATGLAPPMLAILGEDGAWRALPRARPLRRLAALSDGSIVGIDMDSGVFIWRGPQAEPVQRFAASLFIDMERDGEALILLDKGGEVARLDGERLTPLLRRPGARAAAARGPWLAVAEREAVWLRGPSGERLLSAPGASLLDVAISPDRRRVAAPAVDGLIRVWDVESGSLVGVLPGHRERVVSIDFAPNGDLLSASWDHSARVWDLSRLDQPLPALIAEVEAAWPEAPPRADGDDRADGSP